jgi:hypothetical protein
MATSRDLDPSSEHQPDAHGGELRSRLDLDDGRAPGESESRASTTQIVQQIRQAQEPLDAQAEDVAPRCPTCDACERERDNVGPGGQSWDRIKRLTSPTEVVEYPGLVASTHMRHVAARDGIQARYDLSTEVLCSLAGRHRHQQGVVVKALCGITICMGFDCGRRSIVGFSEIARDVRRRVRFENETEYLASWSTQFRAQVARLRPALVERVKVYETLSDKLPELFKRLPAIRLDKSSGVLGLDILDARKHAPAKLDEIRTQFDQQMEQSPPIDGQSSAALMKIARSGNRRVDACRAWVRETTPFTTEPNLKRALIATRREAGSVEAVPGGWRVKHFDSGVGAVINRLFDRSEP